LPKKTSHESTIADLDVEGHQGAIVKPLAMTYCQDFSLLRFLFGGIWDDDAVAPGILFLVPLHHDAVV
jgi:hypothetical protein